MRLRWARALVALGAALCAAAFFSAFLQWLALLEMSRQLVEVRSALAAADARLAQQTEADARIEQNRFFQFRQELLLAIDGLRKECQP